MLVHLVPLRLVVSMFRVLRATKTMFSQVSLGLSVGDEITVPGDEITNAVKRYWKHGLFSKVAIAADSIVGEKFISYLSCGSSTYF